MTKLELLYIAKLLNLAANQFSDHGCNDFPLKNTDENWQLRLDMEKWNGDETAPMLVRPAADQPIYFMDWYLMAYLAHRAQVEHDNQ